ncbi:MAG: hypothetical protein A3J65_00650 [Candidatus Buchananbacteria bacterium RIFCSPHIGHO2_02_FULL_45_11b]|uniref:GIY-YIG domain-containing protein n=4 Tax=Candidatus Buchananiibacteriota TaxID=1817903 RepID=A0A1G1Y7Y8_9BACT|nr:MAG: hypothetical protein A2663_02025 [Candidatus Buchananbacteria bacterium RIFCSPHIGHO2_01_FULL_46_12]OGY52369.1 MAG: hypothetical protein A3J65_00650 [Candidatus Buchananbacteria bacterium RIFCSPHIGHO2_02_FULL_45_11b]OGY53207.1 MAG: hypothetical protein A3B15_02905 [Candidatus Buchananbacteria bacterium RIFCSPLOWO2_01_FULL_45_31]OGY56089.1 MAG: hypothetical protein A3H67_04580 [Candidatus Buchananbacteria bacterium RIFCSPLOWO2_02_FULL_46_11b]
MVYYTYAICSETTEKIYIGHTDNLTERMKRHNNEMAHKKSSYTYKNVGPWRLRYKEEFPTRKEAMIREKQLKSAKGREFIKNLKPLAQSVDPPAGGLLS